MSVSTSESTSSSISSSGLVDGLGRRVLAFDRETGAMLERLHLRPELIVFEQILRERVEHLATLEDERFARPYSVERDPGTGELTVVAEFVAGCRLSDVLETSYDAGLVPGVDVALGFMLEALPALSMLHMVNGVTHGLIDPARIVLTPTGQVVFLDVTFGSAVERLGLSRPRLWTEFGLASPPAPGPVRFDASGDIGQVALAGLMLVLGRSMRADEYPDALPSLLMEVVEVAQIRGSTGFAGGLQRILQRSLPIPGRRPYTTADEAVVDVRQLVRREIGVDVCRQALVGFVGQMDAAFSSAAEAAENQLHSSEYAYAVDIDSGRPVEPIAALEEYLDGSSSESSYESSYESTYETTDATAAGRARDEESPLDMDISLEIDPVVEEAPRSVYDLPPVETIESRPTDDEYPAPAAFEPSYASSFSSAEPSYSDPVPALRSALEPPTLDAEGPAPLVVVPDPDASRPREFTSLASSDGTERLPEPQESILEEPPLTDGQFALAVGPSLDVISDGEPEPEHDEGSVAASETESEPESARSSRRKKRQQQKSVRARKDKLRSTTDQPKTPVPLPLTKEAPSARPAGPSGWLVSPQPDVPTFPTAQPIPAPRIPQPVFGPPSGIAPVYGAPSIAPPRLTPVAPPPQPQPVLGTPQPSSTPVRLKTEPPKGFAPKKTTVGDASVDRPSSEAVTALPYVQRGSMFQTEEPRSFPWKLAAVAVVVAGLAIVIGRSYLPGRQAVIGEPGAVQAATPPLAPAAPADTNDEGSIPAGKGRLIIRTEPAGVKVLLDQKPVGETPLRLDATAGRHVLTFVTSGGEVIRTVRVPSGKSMTVDVPVFSGWVAIFAPVVLEVATGGKTLGTTEQNRLMLPPGRHELTLTNRELGFTGVEVVDIEPGEVKSLNLDPRGVANLNAIPWAEVWLDGLKLGETPIANAKVPLGVREFLFKHPQHGERKVNATIRGNAPAAISVDFTR